MRSTEFRQDADSRETRLPNCRSISSETWEHARQALVFYFQRRGADIDDAEDQAQSTLTALWRRPDYEFQDEKDFLRVCYAFAKRIQKAAWRKGKRAQMVELKDSSSGTERRSLGLNDAEMGVYLDETLKVVDSNFNEEERALLAKHADPDRNGEASAGDSAEQNRERVRVFRIRDKLARLIGLNRKKKAARKKENKS